MLHLPVCVQLQPKTGLITKAKGKVINLAGSILPRKHCAACAKH